MTHFSGANCGNCHFGQMAKGQDGKVDFGKRMCKWGPPTPVFIPTPQGMSLNAAWPVIGFDNHCFQHEAAVGTVLVGEEQIAGDVPVAPEKAAKPN